MYLLKSHFFTSKRFFCLKDIASLKPEPDTGHVQRSRLEVFEAAWHFSQLQWLVLHVILWKAALSGPILGLDCSISALEKHPLLSDSVDLMRFHYASMCSFGTRSG